MKSNALKALELELPKKDQSWDNIQEEIAQDAQVEALKYLKSAKVDLGGE